MLHIIITSGICLAFRFLVLQINRENAFAYWLIFPFCQTAAFYLGFYNFELGVFLALLTTACWIRTESKTMKAGTVVLLTLLSTMLYFTHLVPFLLMVMIVGMRMLLLLFRKDYQLFFRRIALFFISLIPALIVFTIYYSSRTENTLAPAWADFNSTAASLLIPHQICFHMAEQVPIATGIGILLLLAALYAGILFFIRRKTLTNNERNRFVFWFCSWAILVLLTFISPDDFGGSGAMTVRLIEISWIMLLLFVASSSISFPKMMIIALVLAAATIPLSVYHKPTITNGNDYAHVAMSFAPEIKPNKTAVYIAFTHSDNTYAHIGELPFAEKKSILLSSYESAHDFFFVKFRKEFNAQYTIGGIPRDMFNGYAGFWPTDTSKPVKNIDYVFLCTQEVKDSVAFRRLHDALDKDYILKKDFIPFTLYESKTIGQ